uniref:NADH-ubiquinone oxidoreductase chain 2 n=1 Tax=Cacopsylla burckhardti TaxID=2593410 RepID=A0A8K1W3A1_9HEMI|nr:NADH dehydrogenase subunit 2 [Cacopsylla burckhardti]UFP91891.1 NADH dehydrogenase subunit 2 [Cacopsylla burckhardti]WAK85081.1 NADH dehydrogenase subunit 2 [Cacopsylla burckhardti]
MKNYYMIIFPMYIISISFSLSSSSWMSIWIGMEMNLLTFIFMILETKTFNSTESCMKYFLIQSAGSLLFLFSVSVQSTFVNESFFINALAPPLALMLKSGIAPLHFWTPDISMKLSPQNLFLFITMQKIIPMLVMFSSWSALIKWIIPLNIIVGSLGGLTQSSVNKMIIFSSINNSGWMMMSLTESMLLFYIFFLFYFKMNYLLMTFLLKNKIKWSVQIKTQNFFKKLLFVSLMMSLSGLPPFLGFIPKWIILKKITMNLPVISLISIVMSVFTMFFYMKMTINMVLYSSLSKKWVTNFFIEWPSITLVLMNLTSSFLFILLV